MIVWGGVDGSGAPVGSGGLYDEANDKWTPLAQGPSARSDYGFAWSGSKLYVFGGKLGGVAPTDEGWVYDPAQNSWAQLPPQAAPAPRSGAWVVWAGGSLVVSGGKDAQGTKLASGARFDPSQNAWLTLPDAPRPSARSDGAGWAFAQSYLALFVGGSGAQTDPQLDGLRLDVLLGKWSTIPAWPSGQDHRGGAVAFDAELLLWGGGSPTATSDGERWKP
jgi:N-acetylneuraminic acid mutarotase